LQARTSQLILLLVNAADAGRNEGDEMGRQDFVGMFSSLALAVAFEETALSIGDEYLPECAKVARDGGEPTAEYWQWICNEVERVGPCEDALTE
jgi:hypothetical protein